VTHSLRSVGANRWAWQGPGVSPCCRGCCSRVQPAGSMAQVVPHKHVVPFEIGRHAACHALRPRGPRQGCRHRFTRCTALTAGAAAPLLLPGPLLQRRYAEALWRLHVLALTPALHTTPAALAAAEHNDGGRGAPATAAVVAVPTGRTTAAGSSSPATASAHDSAAGVHAFMPVRFSWSHFSNMLLLFQAAVIILYATCTTYAANIAPGVPASVPTSTAESVRYTSWLFVSLMMLVGFG
jgi:hypothetical protein